TPALGLGSVHEASGEQQLAGATLTDDARQDRAGAHVGAGQTDADEEESNLAACRPETQVAGHRENRAGAGADAVDGRDDRLRARAHALDQLACHAREAQKTFGVSLIARGDERADDFVHVAAGGEVPAFAPGEQSHSTASATSCGVMSIRRGECFARRARAASADMLLVRITLSTAVLNISVPSV